jgi:hypothetical protein
MQRKQQVGECWVCVIFFAQLASSVYYVASGAQGGFEGGGFWGKPPRKKFFSSGETCHIFASFFVSSIFMSIVGQFFGTWFFADGFLFLVKELGLLTNLGHWVRVLDVVGSYMYIVL